MKIAVVWWFDKASKVFPNWRDGLRAAIEVIGKKHKVEWFLDKMLPDNSFDFILFWSSTNEDYFDYLHNFSAPKGLCLTTNPNVPENLQKMDVVFCESQPVLDEVRSYGVKG